MKNEQKLFDQLYKKFTKADGTLLHVGYLLQYAAAQFSDQIALICKERTFSYQELYARACGLTHHLSERGIQPHDRVVICFENIAEFYISYFAVWQAGAVVIPLNVFLKEVEIAHIITDAQPVLIITDDTHIALFHNAGVSLPPLMTSQDIQNLVPCNSKKRSTIDDIHADEMVLLLYTSGTTGVPKGVMLSSFNIINNICQSIARLGVRTRERILGVLPLFHSFSQITCVWMSIWMGATIILVRKIERHALLHALTYKPTMVVGVPALYGFFCLLKTAPFDSVIYFVSGGDALPDKIRMLFALVYRRKICDGYGLTEASPVVAADLDGIMEPSNTVGKTLFGIDCSIRDAFGNFQEQTSIGQIWIRGNNIMMGYYNHKKETDEVLQHGWLNTGDLGYVTQGGKLVITGREKDLIIHKGINIYPQEIENVILSHPQVLFVGVIGKVDDEVGEVPIAFVQLRNQTKNIEKDLKKLCMQRLALYKVPKNFICSVEELPKTATGKIDKKILRKQIESS